MVDRYERMRLSVWVLCVTERLRLSRDDCWNITTALTKNVQIQFFHHSGLLLVTGHNTSKINPPTNRRLKEVKDNEREKKQKKDRSSPHLSHYHLRRWKKNKKLYCTTKVLVHSHKRWIVQDPSPDFVSFLRHVSFFLKVLFIRAAVLHVTDRHHVFDIPFTAWLKCACMYLQIWLKALPLHTSQGV